MRANDCNVFGPPPAMSRRAGKIITVAEMRLWKIAIHRIAKRSLVQQFSTGPTYIFGARWMGSILGWSKNGGCCLEILALSKKLAVFAMINQWIWSEDRQQITWHMVTWNSQYLLRGPQAYGKWDATSHVNLLRRHVGCELACHLWGVQQSCNSVVHEMVFPMVFPNSHLIFHIFHPKHHHHHPWPIVGGTSKPGMHRCPTSSGMNSADGWWLKPVRIWRAGPKMEIELTLEPKCQWSWEEHRENVWNLLNWCRFLD